MMNTDEIVIIYAESDRAVIRKPFWTRSNICLQEIFASYCEMNKQSSCS